MGRAAGVAMEPGRIELPDEAWQQPRMRESLRRQDIAGVFVVVQAHGVSQGKIGAATGMSQGRVNEIINHRREVTRLDVFQRIADGLVMPDHARRLLGLAPARGKRTGGGAFDLSAFPEVVRVYDDQAAAAAEIQRQAADAAEVDVLAVRGLGLLGLNNSLLRGQISRPVDPPVLRVLLLDPGCPALERRAAEIGESPQSLAAGIELAEARLRELASHAKVEVYRYRLLPTWRLIRLDKVLYVSAFSSGWEGHESAMYKVLETPNGPLHRGCRRMFEAMLEDGTRSV